MATGPGFPGGNNTYVPVDISNRIRIGFSRNAKKFHLPKYVQYVEVPKGNGYYLKLTAQEAARVVNVQDFAWPDGAPDVNEDAGTESFTFIPFTTQRYRYKFRIGQKAEKQAVWPIVEQHGQIKAGQCMTARTLRVYNVWSTTGNWTQANNADDMTADHTGTATAVTNLALGGSGGGKLDQGTSTVPLLKIALTYAAELINKDTLGVVDSEPDSFYIVMTPTTARKLAASPEVHEYIKGSYYAMEEIKTGQHPNGKYGLPSTIYGYNVVVENAVRVTSRKGATLAKSTVVADGNILMCSRPGELEGVYGAPSFSTLTMFWWNDEMTIETKQDSWDRLTYGRVVEDTYEALTCPASGFLFTAATS
jgi:hypothetical protein